MNKHQFQRRSINPVQDQMEIDRRWRLYLREVDSLNLLSLPYDPSNQESGDMSGSWNDLLGWDDSSVWNDD